jgi:predicted transcriptional regulator
MTRRAPTIPDSELDVLSVLWELKTGTVREILDTLHKRGREWSYATVATLLDRLERKQFISSNRDELAYVYKALIPADDVRHRRLSNILEKLFDNDPSALVLHVVKTYRMKPEEVDKLKDALEKGGRKRTRAASTAKV